MSEYVFSPILPDPGAGLPIVESDAILGGTTGVLIVILKPEVYDEKIAPMLKSGEARPHASGEVAVTMVVVINRGAEDAR